VSGSEALVVDNEVRYLGVLKAYSAGATRTSVMWRCEHDDHRTMGDANRCAEDEKNRRIKAESPSDRVRLAGIHYDILLERLSSGQVRMTIIPFASDEKPTECLLTSDGAKQLIDGLQEVGERAR
jgi:hypothetical protein